MNPGLDGENVTGHANRQTRVPRRCSARRSSRAPSDPRLASLCSARGQVLWKAESWFGREHMLDARRGRLAVYTGSIGVERRCARYSWGSWVTELCAARCRSARRGCRNAASASPGRPSSTNALSTRLSVTATDTRFVCGLAEQPHVDAVADPAIQLAGLGRPDHERRSDFASPLDLCQRLGPAD